MEPNSQLFNDLSPLNQISEESLTDNLDQTRARLKRKLEQRRTFEQLVEQNIITEAPTHEKTRDLLEEKILYRPDRQLLIEQNILHDTNVAPALQLQQQRLKRAKLADNLNDKLAQRPGPLDLIENNILQFDNTNIKQALQGGLIQYPKTSDIVTTLHLPINPYLFDDTRFNNLTTASTTFTPISTIIPESAPVILQTNPCQLKTYKQQVSTKPKQQPRTLVFHEYKGPSEKPKVTKLPISTIEQSTTQEDHQYKVRLQQQQLFLKLIDDEDKLTTIDVLSLKNTLTSREIEENNKIRDDLEEMKLTDLRNECKKLNISTTGNKTKLKLKIKQARSNSTTSTTSNCLETTGTETQPIRLSLCESPLMDQTFTFKSLDDTFSTNELYLQQQQKIVELESELEKLKTIQQPTNVKPKCDPITSVQIQKRILIQQQERLKQKIEQEQFIQQLFDEKFTLPTPTIEIPVEQISLSSNQQQDSTTNTNIISEDLTSLDINDYFNQLSSSDTTNDNRNQTATEMVVDDLLTLLTDYKTTCNTTSDIDWLTNNETLFDDNIFTREFLTENNLFNNEYDRNFDFLLPPTMFNDAHYSTFFVLRSFYLESNNIFFDIKSFSYLNENQFGLLIPECCERLKSFFTEKIQENDLTAFLTLMNYLIENFPFGTACVIHMQDSGKFVYFHVILPYRIF
ncbi:unnamed protein product [Didymodactylos carnosus]|uniref:SAP domain-containing protein n=1 Tax=Didymodactylos carnosus TaxID=1234261 RepID=A0A814NV83_9BILA|nr:unnamed protein product [Didymodactylos carnosus]CAF3863941.1 unnamed protein product [Didymodactylos carnosus]